MERKTITINGVDFTNDFIPSYKVTYVKVTGSNEGTMLSGAYTEDVIAVKARFTLEQDVITEDEQAKLMEAIYENAYATVYYFDPRKKAYRSAVMRYEIGEAEHQGNGTGETVYWTGMTVTFEDRFNME